MWIIVWIYTATFCGHKFALLISRLT